MSEEKQKNWDMGRDYFYSPNQGFKKSSDFEYQGHDNFNYIDFKDDGLFHIGQSYEYKPASTLFCKLCGGNSFNVGQGSYFTALRCVKCEYEFPVHEG